MSVQGIIWPGDQDHYWLVRNNNPHSRKRHVLKIIFQGIANFETGGAIWKGLTYQRMVTACGKDYEPDPDRLAFLPRRFTLPFWDPISQVTCRACVKSAAWAWESQIRQLLPFVTSGEFQPFAEDIIRHHEVAAGVDWLEERGDTMADVFRVMGGLWEFVRLHDAMKAVRAPWGEPNVGPLARFEVHG